jgi:hypothetical protein
MTRYEKIQLGISSLIFVGTIIIILEIAAANGWI